MLTRASSDPSFRRQDRSIISHHSLPRARRSQWASRTGKQDRCLVTRILPLLGRRSRVKIEGRLHHSLLQRTRAVETRAHSTRPSRSNTLHREGRRPNRLRRSITASRMRTEQIVGCPLSFSAKVFPPFPTLPPPYGHRPSRTLPSAFLRCFLWFFFLVDSLSYRR